MMPKQALIVDDSQLAQFVLKKMLREEAIAAECSGSAEDALEYLKTNKPDIIFLDHTMPGMNGLEVLEVIKQDSSTRHIPVMMYTSQEDRRYAEKAMALGAIDVLPKQLKRPDLHRILITLDADKKFDSPQLIDNEHEFLEQIVYDAEEALKHETWQQRFKQAFEEHRENSAEQIQQLNERIDRLMLHQEEQPLKRQILWNNIFWMTLFCLVLGVFAYIYTQQHEALNTLSSQNNQNSNTAIAQETLNTPVPTTPEVAIDNENLDISNSEDLAELEEYFNTNSIPFGELLLGSRALAILEEINTILSTETFKGLVLITPLDSTFCVTTNELGQPVLPEASVLASQCELVSNNPEIIANLSVELQQFMNTQNASNQEYQYLIAPIVNNLTDLPEINETTTAEQWNSVATNNRRIQIEFQPAL